MKICFISDTHGLHKRLEVPAADILIHAGDFSGKGEEWQVKSFINWFTGLPHRYKIFIAGNHDFLAEEDPECFQALLNDQIIYLENSFVDVEGIRIWGSPITPWFYDWAFNRRRGKEIRKYWEAIPSNTDIVVTHGPPLGQGDLTVKGELVGCKDLLDIIETIQPRYHVFGHIHEAYGINKIEQTTFVNASVLDEHYALVNPPIVIDW